MSGIAIMKQMKLQNTIGKQITTLTGIRRKLLIGKDQRNHTLSQQIY